MKKKTIIISSLIILGTAFAYCPQLYVQNIYPNVFNEIERNGQTTNSSASQVDFSSKIKVDRNIEINKISYFSLNPLSSDLYIVNGIRTALSGDKVVDVYYVKLYRNSLFDLNWSVNYPVKVATLVGKDTLWAKQNYKDINFVKMESNEGVYFNSLATPVEVETKRLDYEESQKQKLN